jgi:hypothetical protein
MCDYSLHAVPNRLAVGGEELVTYRFPTRSIGLASPLELQRATLMKQECAQAYKSWWQAVKSFLKPLPELPITAVCIPPGARLVISDIPDALREQLTVEAREDVIFTQRSASEWEYRDAVRFRDGRELGLQQLPTGLRVRVISVEGSETMPEPSSDPEYVLGF